MRGILGLTGYYRKFVKNYGIIAKHLTDLLKKDNFIWSDTTDSAFVSLKEIMSSTPVLALPNFSKPFIIETDACQRDIGTVLMLDRRPLAYLSRAVGVRNMGLSIYENELLVINI